MQRARPAVGIVGHAKLLRGLVVDADHRDICRRRSDASHLEQEPQADVFLGVLCNLQKAQRQAHQPEEQSCGERDEEPAFHALWPLICWSAKVSKAFLRSALCHLLRWLVWGV